MGYITAIVGVQNEAGQRLDLPRSDGTRAPIMLRLSEQFEAESAEEGSFTVLLLSLSASSVATPSDDDPEDVTPFQDPGSSDLYARADHIHKLSQAAIDVVRTISVTAIKANTNYTAALDELVRYNPDGGGTVTITLPTAVGASGRCITIKNVTDSTVAINLATTSSQTIDGAAPGTFSEARGTVHFISDGANWMKRIVSSSGPSAYGSSPADVSTSASAGSSSSYAKGDHVHAIGAAAIAAVRAAPVTAIKTGNYTAAIDEIVRCNPSGGAFAVTLPTAVGNDGRAITVKNVNASTTAITINTTSSQTIDGAASGSITIASAYGTLTFVSDGANWMRFPPA